MKKTAYTQTHQQGEKDRERERQTESIIVNRSQCLHFTYLQLTEVETSSLYIFNWCHATVHEITSINV